MLFPARLSCRARIVFKELTQAFGDEILDDGALNRKKLAAVAFSNQANQRELRPDYTPLYYAGRLFVKSKPCPESAIVVVEATLLFKSPVEPLCCATVAVVADDTVPSRSVF